MSDGPDYLEKRIEENLQRVRSLEERNQSLEEELLKVRAELSSSETRILELEDEVYDLECEKDDLESIINRFRTVEDDDRKEVLEQSKVLLSLIRELDTESLSGENKGRLLYAKTILETHL